MIADLFESGHGCLRLFGSIRLRDRRLVNPRSHITWAIQHVFMSFTPAMVLAVFAISLYVAIAVYGIFFSALSRPIIAEY